MDARQPDPAPASPNAAAPAYDSPPVFDPAQLGQVPPAPVPTRRLTVPGLVALIAVGLMFLVGSSRMIIMLQVTSMDSVRAAAGANFLMTIVFVLLAIVAVVFGLIGFFQRRERRDAFALAAAGIGVYELAATIVSFITSFAFGVASNF